MISCDNAEHPLIILDLLALDCHAFNYPPPQNRKDSLSSQRPKNPIIS